VHVVVKAVSEQGERLAVTDAQPCHRYRGLL
jgi:hypothetical protein